MSKKIFQKVGTVALVAVMAAPFAANAESNFANDGHGLADHDNGTGRFPESLIPKFLSLQVGSAGAQST